MPRSFLYDLQVANGLVQAFSLDSLVASDLPVSGVSSGTYYYPARIQVDQFGRVVSIASGGSLGGGANDVLVKWSGGALVDSAVLDDSATQTTTFTDRVIVVQPPGDDILTCTGASGDLRNIRHERETDPTQYAQVQMSLGSGGSVGHAAVSLTAMEAGGASAVDVSLNTKTRQVVVTGVVNVTGTDAGDVTLTLNAFTGQTEPFLVAASSAGTLAFLDVSGGIALTGNSVMQNSRAFSWNATLVYNGNCAISGDSANLISISCSGVAITHNGTTPALDIRPFSTGAGTTNVYEAIRVHPQITGTPAAGLGSRLHFACQDTTNTDQDQASVAGVWADAAHGSRKGRLVLSVYATTSALEGLRVDSDGTNAISSFGGDVTTDTRLTVIGTALGSKVLRLTTAATNDDPTYDVRQNRVTTTDATVTTVETVAITASKTYLVEARVVARRTGGAAGTADDGAVYVRTAMVTTKAGTVTPNTTGDAPVVIEDQAGWDVTFAASGSNLLVQVTGAANNNITWHSTVIVQEVGT